MIGRGWIIAGVVGVAATIGVAFYFLSAPIAAQSLADAVKAGDRDRIEAGVDFPAVRENLKAQTSTRLAQAALNSNDGMAQIAAVLAPAIVNPMIDTYVTPDGIAELIRQHGFKPTAPSVAPHATSIDLGHAKAHFATLDRYVVAYQANGDTGPPLTFAFERRGLFSWKLVRLELPLDAAPVSPGVSPAPTPQPVQQVATGVAVDWDGDKDGNPRTYRVGDVLVTLRATPKDEQESSVAMAVASDDKLTGEFPGMAVRPDAQLVGTRMDARQPGLGILFETFTGGAHCCTHIDYLMRSNGRWSALALGDYDGDGIRERIRAKDGTEVLVAQDERFGYAFDSGAGSVRPPKLIAIRSGAVVDVSTEPEFKGAFAKQYQALQASCHDHQNGACAALVADGLRIGAGPAAWRIMMDNYDKSSDWGWPNGCDIPTPKNGPCPKEHEIKFHDMPSALRWFLQDAGYGTVPPP